METTQLRIDTVTACNACNQTEELNARIQNLLKAHPAINFKWTPVIRNVFIGPVCILSTKNKPFIYTVFDYKFGPRKRDEITTHFKELISRN